MYLYECREGGGVVKRLFTAVSVVLLTSGLDANADLYGIWQFQDRAVYIDIMESGDVFQCRMTRGWTEVITSSGKLRARRTIVWEPIRMTDADGSDLDTNGVVWGKEKLTLQGESLSLEGPSGVSVYHKTTRAKIPDICRR